MIFKKGMSLIITVVNAGFSQQVIDASKKAGAEGATIICGRGTSRHETTSVLGVQIQPEKELVMILVRKSFRKDIMKQIVRACDLASPGKGLTFCLPVDEVAGLSRLFKNGVFKHDEEESIMQEEKPKIEEKCDAEEKEKFAKAEEMKATDIQPNVVASMNDEEKKDETQQNTASTEKEIVKSNKSEEKETKPVKKVASKTKKAEGVKKVTKTTAKPKTTTKKVAKKPASQTAKPKKSSDKSAKSKAKEQKPKAKKEKPIKTRK